MAAFEIGISGVSSADSFTRGQAESAASGRRMAGGRRLPIESVFCPADVSDPFDTVEWELRSAAIKGRTARSCSSSTTARFPATWSQLATNVVVSKYFYGEVGTPERETSVRQLIHRVSRTIADWGTQDGYFADAEDGERFYRELTWLCLHQHGAFNSPVWFNVGLYHQYGCQGGAVQLALGHRGATRSASRRTRTSIRRRRPASSRAWTTTWKTSCSWPAARPCSSSSAPARAPTCRRCVRTARSSPAAAGRRVRCRSCGSTTRSRRWSSRAARRAGRPRCSRSRSGIPTSWSSSSARTRKSRRPAS